MIPIHFTDQAREDLLSIQFYYEDVTPQSVERVFTDIYSTLEILSRWPHVGRCIKGEGFHQVATAK